MSDLWGWIQMAMAVLIIALLVALVVIGIISEWRLRTGRVRRRQQQPKEDRTQQRTTVSKLPANADEAP